MDHNLYKELYIKRRRLKLQNRTPDGKLPSICSDTALEDMAKYAPKKKEDLLNISGLGQVFVDKYGDEFMQVLNAYHKSKQNFENLDSEVRQTLQFLEQRLVNISRKNRLLYLGKLSNKHSFDLFDDKEFNENLLNLIYGKKKDLVLCSLSAKNPKLDTDRNKYNKLSPLHREVVKDFREHGDYGLYIGYPFVIGKSTTEDFLVRAPLCLFPAVIQRTPKEIKLSIDKTKDVLFNNNLVLLQNKLNSQNVDLPNNVVEQLSDDISLQAIEFFKQNSITIDNAKSPNLVKFEEYTLETFPKFESGEFKLVPNAVLGKFSMYDTSIQRDYRKLIESEKIPTLVDNLLSQQHGTDFYLDAEDTPTFDHSLAEFAEEQINYINSLNASQENAVVQLEQNDSLVIQGPPGTGKSQTITSIIADACLKEKTVLMVSQKKAALDVIYSRLGNLSKFALFVDNAKNKESFFTQLQNMTLLEDAIRFDSRKLDGTNRMIDADINRFKRLDTSFYQENETGTSMCNIYQQNLACRQTVDEFLFAQNINSKLLKLKYDQLSALKKTLQDDTLTQTCLAFCKLAEEYPWFEQIDQNLDTMQIIAIKSQLKTLQDQQTKLDIKGGFVKLFSGGKIKKQLQKIASTLIKNEKLCKEISKNADILSNGLQKLDDYYKSKNIYQTLSDNEKLFVVAIFNINKTLKIDAQSVLQQIFDFIVFAQIKDFERKHSATLLEVDKFDKTLSKINSNFDAKMEEVKEKTACKLMACFAEYISSSKRYNEFKRNIDSKRKPSINKFVAKFNFELSKGIRIWLMTPETVSEIFPLFSDMFDLLIFDEASQIYVEKAIPSIARCKKVVVAGDHKQLRPSNLGFGRITGIEEDLGEDEEFFENAALEEESLLDLTRFKYKEVLLNYHYRSKYEELISFSNYAFYKGRLNVSPNTTKPDTPPIEVIKIEDGLWDNRKNLKEAQAVVALVKEKLYAQTNDTYGVITFNTAQRDLILDLLDEECQKDSKFASLYYNECERKENGEDLGFFVKNIENVQGDERDCIIFSLAYAKNADGKVIHNFGWLNQVGGENRLNVAISRSKKKIYIVTSITAEQLSVDKLENEGPKIFKKYLQYCNAISSGDYDLAQAVLKSFVNKDEKVDKNTSKQKLHKDIIAKIKSLGYPFDLNVGIGAYKIDIAIKDKAGNYVLGIDFDDNIYRKYTNTRERDIHRQKYLEGRGWKMYRLWTTRWWKDQNKELECIKSLLPTE